MSVEKVANAIEADAGMALAELRAVHKKARAGIGRVTTPEQILLRQARAKTGLSQAEFAMRIATPVATLRDWEHGRVTPPGGVLCSLKLIDLHPELSIELETA